MTYHVIYDGNCNLCVNWVKWLEQIDRGQRFQYTPMQDPHLGDRWGITPEDCALGVILLDAENPDRRWQGTAAIEEIGRMLPGGSRWVEVYRYIPGLKGIGDRLYAQVRDHRYSLFGSRSATYTSPYTCESNACSTSISRMDGASRG